MNKFRLFLFRTLRPVMGADLLKRREYGEGIGRYWGASGTGECGTLCCVFVYVPRGGLTKTPTPRYHTLASFFLFDIYLSF